MCSECLTDNSTDEDEELRLHGLCWCSSSASPPSPCFQTPWPNIRIQNNCGAGLSPASCVPECLMCSFLYSVRPDICMFFYQQLVCFIICFYITLFCFSHFPLLLSLHYLKCSFIKSFNCNRYFKAVRRPQTWRTKMRIRKTWSLSSKTVKKHLIIHCVPRWEFWYVFPYLTQASCKSALIGEPRLDRGVTWQ